MNWHNVGFTLLASVVSIGISYFEKHIFQPPIQEIPLNWENSVFIDSSNCIPWNRLYYSNLKRAGIPSYYASEIARIQSVYQPESPIILQNLLLSNAYQGIPLIYWRHIIDWTEKKGKTVQSINKNRKKSTSNCQLPHWLEKNIQKYGQRLNGFFSSEQLSEVYGYSKWMEENCTPKFNSLTPVRPLPIDSLISNHHPYFNGICAGISNYCDSIYPYRKYYILSQ